MLRVVDKQAPNMYSVEFTCTRRAVAEQLETSGEEAMSPPGKILFNVLVGGKFLLGKNSYLIYAIQSQEKTASGIKNVVDCL